MGNRAWLKLGHCWDNPLKNPIPKNTEISFLEEIRQNFNNFRPSALQKENYYEILHISDKNDSE